MRRSWLRKELILLAMLTGTCQVAWAQADRALADCRQIDDDQQRLACYDAIAGQPATVTSPAPPPRPAAAQQGADQRAAVSAPAATPAVVATPAGAVKNAPAPASAGPGASAPQATPAPRPVALPAAESAADRFGSEQLDAGEDEPEQLVSRIVGDYDGWFGNTVFRLENGQVWVQAQAGTSRYKGPSNPRVTIERRVFGSYRLQVEGSNKTVRVKRLE